MLRACELNVKFFKMITPERKTMKLKLIIFLIIASAFFGGLMAFRQEITIFWLRVLIGGCAPLPIVFLVIHMRKLKSKTTNSFFS